MRCGDPVSRALIFEQLGTSLEYGEALFLWYGADVVKATI
jgi:hypothetical protein